MGLICPSHCPTEDHLPTGTACLPPSPAAALGAARNGSPPPSAPPRPLLDPVLHGGPRRHSLPGKEDTDRPRDRAWGSEDRLRRRLCGTETVTREREDAGR